MGVGCKIDHAKALELYQIAADKGVPSAQCNLGYAYLYGIGIEQNHEMAFKWYSAAVEQGFPDAFGPLGVCYEMGYGVERNIFKARELYRVASSHGDSNATQRLQTLDSDTIARLDQLIQKGK